MFKVPISAQLGMKNSGDSNNTRGARFDGGGAGGFSTSMQLDADNTIAAAALLT